MVILVNYICHVIRKQKLEQRCQYKFAAFDLQNND